MMYVAMGVSSSLVLSDCLGTGCRRPDTRPRVNLVSLGSTSDEDSPTTQQSKNQGLGLCGPEEGAVPEEGAHAFASMS